MFEHALIAMKAYPFHKGHEFLIQSALNESKRVTVLNTWRADEHPHGEIRANWIRQTFPQVDVRCVVDIAIPEEDPNSSAFWAVYARDILKGDQIDVVFSSEHYGDEWAKELGVAHRVVDKARTYLPISGTEIRSDPYLYWNYINEHARQFYLKRVLILGAESTGKTTLCKNLSLRYGTTYAPEYGRIYDEQTRGPKEEFDPLRWRLLYANLVNEQPVLNRRAEADARHLVFYDTDLWTTSMWYNEWMPEYGEDALYESIVDAASHEEIPDLVLIQDLAPFVDDGMRGQTEETRERFTQQFIKLTRARGLNMQLLTGSWQQRESTAINAINQLFSNENSKVTLPLPITSYL